MFPECAAEECTSTDSGQIIHEMEEIWNSSGNLLRKTSLYYVWN